MKKLLLTLTASLLIIEVQAQLPLENFNGPGMPAGWTMIKADNNTVNASAFAAPIPTVLIGQAWMKRLRATGDSAMLTVSNFAPGGTADRWLVTPSFMVNDPNMVIKWEDWESAGANYSDSVQVWVSTTGGATPSSFAIKIYDGPASPDATPYGTHAASLSSFNGQSVRIAFRNNCTQQGALRLDNVQTQNMSNALDAGISAVNFENIVATTGSYPVSVVFVNDGAQSITSIQASYSVDGGSPVTQTFNGLNVAPLGSVTVTFTSQITNPAVGAHTITANILQVNSAADPIAANNQGAANFAVATASVPRNGLIEEYTSSTCAPCAAFNSWWDPMITSATNKANDPASHFNVVKYQMNWPSPYNDVSYNPDGNGRRGFYGVNAIPDHYTNGEPGVPLGSPQNLYQTEIGDCKTNPSFMTISGTYTVKGDSIIAVVTVMPNFTLSGGGYKLYLAATENHYQNPGNTTGQLDYYHVMRKMLPDYNGIPISSFTAGVPQTFTEKYKFTVGNVAQGNYNFWSTPFDGHLVAFVQNVNTKDVLQSVSIPAQWPTAIGDVTATVSGVQLFPNPAKERVQLIFTLQTASAVNVTVVNALGKVVLSYNEKMGNGEQRLSINTQNFAAGIYNVMVEVEDQTLNQKLTVIK
jgi:hypothetical protein